MKLKDKDQGEDRAMVLITINNFPQFRGVQFYLAREGRNWMFMSNILCAEEVTRQEADNIVPYLARVWGYTVSYQMMHVNWGVVYLPEPIRKALAL